MSDGNSDWTRIKRTTGETEVALQLRLSGTGEANVESEPYFLGHMLETLARHGGLDLELSARGEDEHHLIEDVGIALGHGIRKALPDLKVARIAHAVVPMDDALVVVALDLVDRPFASVDLPDGMYAHMLRSMALDGKFTLHVRSLAGDDTHHVVEAAFKGLGRALQQAVRPASEVASTKGEVRWA